jgi:hypothetical protein
LKNNGLSIVFISLFIVSLIAHSITGFDAFNQQKRSHSQAAIHYIQYLKTGNFLDSLFVNWQAAILQLGCLILFSEFLYQKGASHSRNPEKKRYKHRIISHKLTLWFHDNSLSIVFLIVFIISFTAHLIFGTRAFNENGSLTYQAPISIMEYLTTADFWFKATQTWQAEFFGIGLFIILSIFLRQSGSAESKPAESKNEDTGDVNE